MPGLYVSAWDKTNQRGGGATSLHDGSYIISGLANGNYKVEVNSPVGNGIVNSVTVQDADQNQDIRLVKNLGTISGTITGSGASTALIFVYNNTSNHYVGAITAHEDGAGTYSYSIDDLATNTKYRLEVDTDGIFSTIEWPTTGIAGTVTPTTAAPDATLDINL